MCCYYIIANRHPFRIDTLSYTIDLAGSFIVVFSSSHDVTPLRDKQIF